MFQSHYWSQEQCNAWLKFHSEVPVLNRKNGTGAMPRDEAVRLARVRLWEIEDISAYDLLCAPNHRELVDEMARLRDFIRGAPSLPDFIEQD